MWPTNILICFAFTWAFKLTMTLIWLCLLLFLLYRQYVLEGCLWVWQIWISLYLGKVAYVYILLALIWDIWYGLSSYYILSSHQNTLPYFCRYILGKPWLQSWKIQLVHSLDQMASFYMWMIQIHIQKWFYAGLLLQWVLGCTQRIHLSMNSIHVLLPHLGSHLHMDLERG